MVIPVFMEAVLPVMGISIYFICCFSSFFFFFPFPFLFRGAIEKMLITLTKSQKFKSDLKAQAIYNRPLLCTAELLIHHSAAGHGSAGRQFAPLSVA